MYYDLYHYVEYPGTWSLGNLMFHGDKVDSRMFQQGKKLGSRDLVLRVLRPDKCVVPGYERMVVHREMTDRSPSDYSEIIPLEKGWEQQLVLPVRKEGIVLDYSSDLGMMPLVNKSLAEALLKLASDDIQLLPVEILSHKEEYFILNVTQIADCIDERRTRGLLWKPGMAGRPRKYSALADIHIDPARTGGHKLFRLQHWEMVLICSQEVKDLFERLEVKGALFRPVV